MADKLSQELGNIKQREHDFIANQQHLHAMNAEQATKERCIRMMRYGSMVVIV